MTSSHQTVLDFRPQRNSSANSSGSPEAGGAPRQACIGCKRRKVRCDSAKPSCGYCTQRGKECVYPSPYKRAACSQSHVEELERRVLEYGMKLGINDPLAEPLSKDQPRKQTKKRNPKPPQEESAEQPHSPSTADAPQDPGTHESVVPEGIDETHTETSSEDFPVMDGMVSYARSPPQQGRPTSFFGPSSTFNFVMKMKTANDVSPTGTHAHTSPSAHPSRKRPRDEMEHDDDERARKFLTSAHHEFFALPQRHVAKFLLDKYFTAVHPVWPFLIESETRTHFDQTWSSDTPQSSMWLAILNLIFALGCQFCEDAQQGNMAEVPIENPLQAGAEFYHRARGFVLTNLFDSGSIECVQALLLMAQYQQGTMRPNQCWLTVGHATRMSQGIGLHLDTTELKISPLERELGKRLWWGCFCLDRVTSMIYGRPVAIPRDHLQECDFPLAIDDKYLARSEDQPAGTISTHAFFVANITLYLVMDDILARIYRGRAATTGPAVLKRKNQFPFIKQVEAVDETPLSYLTAVMQLEKELMDWHASLPELLQFSLEDVKPDLRGSPELQRQRNILNARFLGIRILLHRQTMLYLVQDPLEKSDPLKVANVLSTIGPPMPKPNTPLSPFEISISRVSAGICVKAAHLQIESVHLFRKMKLTGAFWWNFYFTFNAICALSGALALGEEDRRVVLGSAGGLKGLIAKGFFDLQDMRKQTPMVERSEAFLRQLLKAAERTTGQQQETKERGRKGKPVQSTKSIEIPASIPDTTSVESTVPLPTASLENMDPGFNFGEGFDELSINPLFGEDSPSLIDILAAAGPPNPEVALSGLGGGGNGDLQSFEDLLQNSFDVWNFFQSPEMSSAQPQLWR